MRATDRRSFLHTCLGGLVAAGSAPLFGGLAGCQQLPAREARAAAAPNGRGGALPTQQLTDRISVISGAPGNVIALSSQDGVLLVDSGSAPLASAVRASLAGAHVHTVFNTHYHSDQTGGNPLFGGTGAVIRSHVVTRQWLAADYYVPADDRWVKALPVAGVPTVTFRQQGELTVGAENVEFGYLLEAHTRGDIYVMFRDSNVLVVGDVASPQRDPVLDWYSGAWIGGRVDAMSDLLKLANDDTRIVPAYGPVMTRAQLQTERDMMQKLYDRTTLLTTQGRSAQEMLDAGVIKETNREFKDPYRFLYDVSKGLWAHYTNFGGNIL